MPEFNCLKPFGLNLTKIICHKEKKCGFGGVVLLFCFGFFLYMINILFILNVLTDIGAKSFFRREECIIHNCN